MRTILTKLFNYLVTKKVISDLTFSEAKNIVNFTIRKDDILSMHYRYMISELLRDEIPNANVRMKTSDKIFNKLFN